MTDSCEHLLLAMSKYCRIYACLKCQKVHFELPYHISMQFQFGQFFGIVESFIEANENLQTLQSKQSWQPVVVDAKTKKH